MAFKCFECISCFPWAEFSLFQPKQSQFFFNHSLFCLEGGPCYSRSSLVLERLPFDKVHFSVIGLDPQAHVTILLCSSTHTRLPLFFLHSSSPRTPTCSLPMQPGQGLWVHAQLLSRVRPSVTPWTVDRQAPLSMGLSRQEYWSGLLFLSPGDLPDPGMEPLSPVSPALQVDSYLLSTWEGPGRVSRISPFFFIHLFIYFWLWWVFFAVLRLSPVMTVGAAPPCGVRAPHCDGFSCGAQALGTLAR